MILAVRTSARFRLRRRNRERTTTAKWARVFATVLGAALLSGCVRVLPPRDFELPPSTPHDAPVAPTPTPTPRTATFSDEPIDVASEEAPTFVESEGLPSDRKVEPGALPPSPSPLDSLGPATAARTVAATRLTEEARLRMNAGDHDGALEQLERAIAVDPQNGFAYYFLAEVSFERGAYDQSVLFAERAAAFLPAANAEWVSRAHLLQGRVFETVGRFADARAAYRRALEADPSNVGARYGLVRLGGPNEAP